MMPKPRYSAEHKAQGEQESRPLFTFDIWFPGDRRSKITGVLVDSEIREIVSRLRRVSERAVIGPDLICDACDIGAEGHQFDCPEAQV